MATADDARAWVANPEQSTFDEFVRQSVRDAAHSFTPVLRQVRKALRDAGLDGAYGEYFRQRAHRVASELVRSEPVGVAPGNDTALPVVKTLCHCTDTLQEDSSFWLYSDGTLDVAGKMRRKSGENDLKNFRAIHVTATSSDACILTDDGSIVDLYGGMLYNGTTSKYGRVISVRGNTPDGALWHAVTENGIVVKKQTDSEPEVLEHGSSTAVAVSFVSIHHILLSSGDVVEIARHTGPRIVAHNVVSAASFGTSTNEFNLLVIDSSNVLSYVAVDMKTSDVVTRRQSFDAVRVFSCHDAVTVGFITSTGAVYAGDLSTSHQPTREYETMDVSKYTARVVEQDATCVFPMTRGVVVCDVQRRVWICTDALLDERHVRLMRLMGDEDEARARARGTWNSDRGVALLMDNGLVYLFRRNTLPAVLRPARQGARFIEILSNGYLRADDGSLRMFREMLPDDEHFNVTSELEPVHVENFTFIRVLLTKDGQLYQIDKKGDVGRISVENRAEKLRYARMTIARWGKIAAVEENTGELYRFYTNPRHCTPPSGGEMAFKRLRCCDVKLHDNNDCEAFLLHDGSIALYLPDAKDGDEMRLFLPPNSGDLYTHVCTSRGSDCIFHAMTDKGEVYTLDFNAAIEGRTSQMDLPSGFRAYRMEQNKDSGLVVYTTSGTIFYM